MIEWSDEQKKLRKSLDEYGERLSEGHVEDDANYDFNREKWELIRETGVLGLTYDEEWGGLGQDALTMVYVLENLGYACRDSGLLFSVATQIVASTLPIHKFGSDYLKDKYLKGLVDGSILCAHAISEPDAGSDATAMTTIGVEDGDSFVLNGKKAFCTSGPVADVITVYAKAEAEGGATDITAYLVPTDTPGFEISDSIPKMGLNTSPIGSIELNDVRIPKENVIGKVGGGFFILEHVMTWEILGIFSMMAGEMQARLEKCIKFAKRRKQFGEPIGANQFISGPIVDMKIDLETSRKHIYDTAERFANGRSVTTEIAMAKIVTAEANLKSALTAVQIHGGSGYMQETGLEKDLRAAVGAPIYSGTNEMQRVRIASMLGLGARLRSMTGGG